MVYNLWASIVYSRCLCGYVLRSKPSTEKVEAASRRIFNSGGGKGVIRLFLGRSGARATRTQGDPL